MPVPWAALGTILKQAPLLIAAADTLLSRSRGKTGPAADIATLQHRVAELEQHQQATAALAKELAEQAQILAGAATATAAKARLALRLAAIGLALAAIALLVAWLAN
jgi:hypothetical protein